MDAKSKQAECQHCDFCKGDIKRKTSVITKPSASRAVRGGDGNCPKVYLSFPDRGRLPPLPPTSCSCLLPLGPGLLPVPGAGAHCARSAKATVWAPAAGTELLGPPACTPPAPPSLTAPPTPLLWVLNAVCFRYFCFQRQTCCAPFILQPLHVDSEEPPFPLSPPGFHPPRLPRSLANCTGAWAVGVETAKLKAPRPTPRRAHIPAGAHPRICRLWWVQTPTGAHF